MHAGKFKALNCDRGERISSKLRAVPFTKFLHSSLEMLLGMSNSLRIISTRIQTLPELEIIIMCLGTTLHRNRQLTYLYKVSILMN
jgi:hypothetical protein